MATATYSKGEEEPMCTDVNDLKIKLSESQDKSDPGKNNGDMQRMRYRPSDNPPLHLALFFALQNILVALPWCLTQTILVADFVCAENDYTTKAMLFSSTLLMSGLTSLAEVTIGVRLPIVQGPSLSYVTPLIILKELPEWKCPSVEEYKHNLTTSENMHQNNSGNHLDIDYRTFIINPRLQLTMGSLVLTGCIHMCTGMFGFIGCLMKLVGPITVIPAVLLIGLSTFQITTKFCMIHWGIAATTCITSIILSLYLDGCKMPLVAWNKDKRWHVIRYPLHQVLSILFSIIVGWILSAILTVTDVLPNNTNSTQYMARTDVRSDVIRTTPWFYLPYPGQFGSMSFSSGIFAVFLLATLHSIIDSLVDYYACARTARVPSPPTHAINRGIMIEGLFEMVSGLFGTGHATTTYGINIGTMGVTKILFSIIVGWILSAILTVTDVLPNNTNSTQYMARTDVRSDVIRTTPWFYLPYPGQFGSMSFSSGIFAVFLLATLHSIIDSLVDYYACARTARVPSPPTHAINRGIMIEGLFEMVSGLFGTGHATTTYGINIGTMGVTKVASRFVYILCPCLLILFSVVGKFAAVLITIPYPVIGGVQILGFGIFLGLVLSNLQCIDLNSTRNLAIIGVSILLGLMLPFWVRENSNVINTGHNWLDSLIQVILANPSLVGGFTVCFLDNTVPGTLHERGLLAWNPCIDNTNVESVEYDEGYEIYEIPTWSAVTNKLTFTKHIPFFPNYKVSSFSLQICKKNDK